LAYPLLVAAALSLLALIPLLQRHLFASSDGLYHIYRAIEIGQCLQDGALVCRWAPTQYLGYGTPLFNFYSPFVYYLTNVFHWLGFGWMDATRLMVAFWLLFSAVAAYLYAAEWLSKRAALVVSVAYVYVPYHLVNAYYRGDLPEFAAMAWFPFLAWSFSRLARPIRSRRDWLFLPLTALAYAGLIITHNLSAYIYTGILVVYCAWLLLVNRLEGNYRSVLSLARPAARLVAASILAGALSAFLSVPALVEKEQVTLEGLLYVSHTDHFPTLQQILPNSIVHGYGIIFPDSPVYAYKLGLVQALLGGLGALVAFVLWRRFGWRARGEAVISITLFALAFYFTQPASLWLWDSIPLLPHAQFPWRFLLLMAVPTSLMVGYLVDAGPERWRTWITPPLVAFALLTNLIGLKPIMTNTLDQEVDLRSSVEFELLYHLMGTTVAGEYIPRTAVDRPFVNPTALAWTVGGEAGPVHPTASDPAIRVDVVDKRPTSASYRVDAPAPGQVVLNTVFFSGWRAWLDGQPVTPRPNDPQGLIALDVPAGRHDVRLAFENTHIRTFSEHISLAALALTIGLFAFALWPARGRAAGVEGVATPSRRLDNLLAALAPGRSALERGLAIAPFLVAVIGLPLGIKLFAESYRPPAPAQYPIKIDLGSALQLLGYDVSQAGRPLQRRETVPPGSTLDLTVYWRPLEAGDRVATSRVYARLSNIDEQQWSQAVETDREPLDGGQLFRSHVKLPIPAAQPPGVYQIDIGAVGRDGRPFAVRNMEQVELLPTQGSVRLGPLLVRRAPPAGQAAALRLPGGVNFEQAVQLESYEVSKGVDDRRLFVEPANPASPGGPLQAAAGDTLQLDFLWRALRGRLERYTISASLVDERGFKFAVRDAEPADRMYPTWMWGEGEAVRDQLRMIVPPETPPGRYRLSLRVLRPDGRPLSVLGANGNPAGGQADLVPIELSRTEIPVRPRELKNVASRDRVRVNDDLEVVAADYGRAELRPGETSDVTLIWHSLRDVKREYAVRLKLLGPNNADFGTAGPFPAAGELNPTDRWERDSYFRGQYRLAAAAGARPGTARLTIELLDPLSGEVLASARAPADVKLLERPGGSAPDRLKSSADFAFGPSIRLVGYELKPDGPARAGEPLNVSLLWQAEREPGQAYTVFAQLLDADGKLVAQHDSPPASGRAPTSGWVAGLMTLDEHRIDLPKELKPGEYRLIVGLYDASGKRLELPDGQNFAPLATVRLR
jgi:hypothetical protein